MAATLALLSCSVQLLAWVHAPSPRVVVHRRQLLGGQQESASSQRISQQERQFFGGGHSDETCRSRAAVMQLPQVDAPPVITDADERITTGASIIIHGVSTLELYTAYADLTRMTEWSPLLEEVSFDEATRESSWALRVPRPLRFLARATGFGELAIRWQAVNVEESPPQLLRWRSLSGMENAGSARFEQLPNGAVNMTLSIVYPMPESVKWFGESALVQRFVRSTMLYTMRRFKRIMEKQNGKA